MSIRVHPWLKSKRFTPIVHPKMNSGNELPSASVPKAGLRRDKSVFLRLAGATRPPVSNAEFGWRMVECAARPRFQNDPALLDVTESGAQATALQTLARPLNDM